MIQKFSSKSLPGLMTGHEFQRQLTHKTLSFGDEAIDLFFQGGIPIGEISEFGMPQGAGGRRLILHLLSILKGDQKPILWVCGNKALQINPATWLSYGVDLRSLRVAYSQNPLIELQPLFLESLFKVIVLDGVPSLSQDALSFLYGQVRQQQQVYLLLREFWLKNERGNVWSKIRVNCRKTLRENELQLEIIKGGAPKKRTFLFPTPIPLKPLSLAE